MIKGNVIAVDDTIKNTWDVIRDKDMVIDLENGIIEIKTPINLITFYEYLRYTWLENRYGERTQPLPVSSDFVDNKLVLTVNKPWGILGTHLIMR